LVRAVARKLGQPEAMRCRGNCKEVYAGAGKKVSEETKNVSVGM
jgi:hypothetical protein